MMNKKRSISYKIALGGILSALSLSIMFLTGIPASMYIFPAISGLILWVIAENTTKRWGILCFFATGLLSLFTIPDLEAKLMFIFLLGYYPIVREKIEQIFKLHILRYLIKLVLFNITAVLAYTIIFVFFPLQYLLDQMDELGQYGVLIFLGLGNFAFLLYDFFMSQFFFAYQKWLKPKFVRNY